MLEYQDPETGLVIVTNSMLKTMRRCPKQFQYKYIERLKPRIGSKPLERGKWLHALLEAYYNCKKWDAEEAAAGTQGADFDTPKPETWEEVHAQWSERFAELFDEEKEELGDLPRECKSIFKSYLWHYHYDEDWIVHETEWTIDVRMGSKFLYRGRVDMLVENDLGFWLVDHKSHKSLPNNLQRLLDSQSALYVWACNKMGIPIQGFIWNYLRTKAPGTPELIRDGAAITTRRIDTTYYQYATQLKRYQRQGIPIQEKHRAKLATLKNERYTSGMIQTSEFFRREIMEKDDAMLQRIANEAHTTAQRANSLPWLKLIEGEAVERVPDRSCGWMCSYTDLCATELFGGNADNIRRQRFKVGDPLDYYQDEKEKAEIRG